MDRQLIRFIPSPARGQKQLGIRVENELYIVVIPLQNKELQKTFVLDVVLRHNIRLFLHQESEPEGVAGRSHFPPFLDGRGISSLAITNQSNGSILIVIASDPIQIPPLDHILAMCWISSEQGQEHASRRVRVSTCVPEIFLCGCFGIISDEFVNDPCRSRCDAVTEGEVEREGDTAWAHYAGFVRMCKQSS